MPISKQEQESLADVVKSILSSPRGILAADQTPNDLDKKLKSIGGNGGYEERLAFRKETLTANMSNYIGGVILHDESVRSNEDIVGLLTKQGITVGGTVDKDFTTVEGSDEPLTQGMGGLEERCKEYKRLGCKFVKWRSIILVSSKNPSKMALEENLSLSGRYATIAQKAGLVPICEPDLQFAGNHSVERFLEVSELAWTMLFKKLEENGVYFPGIILKPSWIIPGLSFPGIQDDEACARITVSAIKKHVPPTIGGIAFLSGGIPLDRCLSLLKHINLQAEKLGLSKDLRLTFSLGRALLDEPARVFVRGEGFENTRKSLLTQVRLASEASTPVS